MVCKRPRLAVSFHTFRLLATSPWIAIIRDRRDHPVHRTPIRHKIHGQAWIGRPCRRQVKLTSPLEDPRTDLPYPVLRRYAVCRKPLDVPNLHLSARIQCAVLKPLASRCISPSCRPHVGRTCIRLQSWLSTTTPPAPWPPFTSNPCNHTPSLYTILWPPIGCLLHPNRNRTALCLRTMNS